MDSFTPIAVRAADIDGDGDMDVLGAARTADDIAWWENADGAGTSWNFHIVDATFNGAVSVGAADIDGDGTADYVLIGNTGALNILYFNTRGSL